MRKTIVTVALAGSLGLAGAALLSPSAASAADATPSPAAAVADRVSRIKDALKGLVSDKTLTQAQADKVASTLAQELPRGPRGEHGPGGLGRGAHLDPAAVAKAAGATVEELRAARAAGQTLAQLAQSNGVSKATLIDRLVTAGEAALDAEVKEGDLTQAQADARKAGLRARVTETVDRVGPADRPGRGPHGHDGDHDGDGPGAAPGTPGSSTPGASATPSVGA